MEDVAKYVDRIIAMGEGRVQLDGTPREVFAHAERLKAIGLDIPQVTQLGNLLAEQGFSVPETILSLDEMQEKLLHILKG